ncbi:hypothetical protein, partial [Novipirellula maiorica]|uniref:hypothetical protein n=1 Tax=Novipirellula maiorica TaxID=1265734 RepID=UPI000594E8EA
SVGVMPITVAALMTTKWLLRHLNIPESTTHVIVPGYLETGYNELQNSLKTPVICGPKDCRDLPEVFGNSRPKVAPSEYDIQIIAEINHAPRMTVDTVLGIAKQLHESGADVIDFGCDPASRCNIIGDYIGALVETGLKVSVDTFDTWEANEATRRGASLVLSVNSTNCEAAKDWGAEVVVIPDQVDDKKSFEKTINYLARHQVPMRLDPILEPIGAGLVASLIRYADARRDYPELEIMMGIGNLTELTEVDSAGINFLLLGICQELGIRSVLTTEVINWARSSVRECAEARKLVYYSVKNRVPPKHLSNALVQLRDPKLKAFPSTMLQSLATTLKDNNYRIYAQDETIHLLSAGMHLQQSDPFALFDQLLQRPESSNVDPGHAFYLGYEMAKASIALQLGKQYDQDQALRWGMLTQEEDLHRIERKSRHRKP